MIRRVLLPISVAAAFACERASHEPAARLAAARPYRASAAQPANEILAGTRRCESPLIAPDVEGGAGRRVAALVFVPPGHRPALTMGLWHFDSLGAPLGHGWHQVTAIAHVD